MAVLVVIDVLVGVVLDTDITHRWVRPGMDEFRIVLVQDLLVDDRRVFVLLAEAALEHRQLSGQESAKDHGREDGGARSRVRRGGG